MWIHAPSLTETSYSHALFILAELLRSFLGPTLFSHGGDLPAEVGLLANPLSARIHPFNACFGGFIGGST